MYFSLLVQYMQKIIARYGFLKHYSALCSFAYEHVNYVYIFDSVIFFWSSRMQTLQIVKVQASEIPQIPLPSS